MTDNRINAFLLFQEGWSDDRIAKQCGVEERTVRSWKKDGAWKDKCFDRIASLVKIESNLIKTIELRSTQILEKLASATDFTDKNLTGEIDSLQKLCASLRITIEKETWKGIIGFAKRFCEHVANSHPESKEKAMELMDEYVKSRRAEF
jgi:transposase